MALKWESLIGPEYNRIKQSVVLSAGWSRPFIFSLRFEKGEEEDEEDGEERWGCKAHSNIDVEGLGLRYSSAQFIFPTFNSKSDVDVKTKVLHYKENIVNGKTFYWRLMTTSNLLQLC